MSLKIRWLGHASFLITTESDKRIFLDPWIKTNPVCPIKIEDVKKADIVCVTHGHPDHLGDAFEIVMKTDAVLICSPEIGVIAERKGIKYDGKNSYPLNIGGSVTVKGIEVTMTSAAHTSDTWEGDQLITGSGSCGYIVVTDDGIRTYYAGDTGLFGDMKLIGQIYAPHIAILPVGGKYNMGIREAAFAASFLCPDIMIPMHYGTYPNQKADIAQLVKHIKTLAPRTKVVDLKVGDEYKYPV
jgi:L-ascorbate metabolism protein UlaG (beta-lactamase superfamily)